MGQIARLPVDLCTSRRAFCVASGRSDTTLALWLLLRLLPPLLAVAKPPELPGAGIQLLQQARNEEALSVFRSQLAKQPDDIEAHFFAGTSLLMMENYDGARKSFEKVLEIDPLQASSWTNLGSCLKNLDSSADAQHAFQRAYDLDPKSITAAFNLAETLMKKESSEGTATAAQRLKEVLALDPSHVLALVYLAELTSSKRKIKALLKKLMKLQMVSGEALRRMAVRLKNLSLMKEEFHCLQKALKQDPKDVSALASTHQNLLMQSFRSSNSTNIRRLQERLYDLWKRKNALDHSERSQWLRAITRVLDSGRGRCEVHGSCASADFPPPPASGAASGAASEREGRVAETIQGQKPVLQSQRKTQILPPPLSRRCQRISAAKLSAGTFYSDYVLKSQPVVIYGREGGGADGGADDGAAGWGAGRQEGVKQELRREHAIFGWDLEHLRERAGNETVNVALTYKGVLNKIVVDPAEWAELSRSNKSDVGSGGNGGGDSGGGDDGNSRNKTMGPFMLRPVKVPMLLADLVALLRLKSSIPLYLYQTGLEAFLPTLLHPDPVDPTSKTGSTPMPAVGEPSWLPPQLRDQLRSTNLWLSAGATTTPLHFDASENVLSQIHGTKVVTLFPPMDAVNLYYAKGMQDVQPDIGNKKGLEEEEPQPTELADRAQEGGACKFGREGPCRRHWREALLNGSIKLIDAIRLHGSINTGRSLNTTNHSPVDHVHPDLQYHPLAAQALAESALRCTVHSGERLFIPAYWHHAVESASEGGYNLALTTWHVPAAGFTRPW
jgi:tetratricopeptide (TPR) repeat protein